MKLKRCFFLTPLAFLFSMSAFSLPNPAAVKCAEVGGDNVTVTSDAGDIGLCKIDSALIGDWTLYRQLGNTYQKAVKAYENRHNRSFDTENDRAWIPNPAAKYCVNVGGKIVLANDAQGRIGLCEFSDRSIIEEWTLYKGPNDPAHSRFNDILRISTKKEL